MSVRCLYGRGSYVWLVRGSRQGSARSQMSEPHGGRCEETEQRSMRDRAGVPQCAIVAYDLPACGLGPWTGSHSSSSFWQSRLLEAPLFTFSGIADKRLTMELLEGYFQGEIDARQFARRMQESGDYGFTGDGEFYALVTAAFQRAADAQLAHQPHTIEDESKLLRSLAALKQEFGLPDLYRTAAWRPGRE